MKQKYCQSLCRFDHWCKNQKFRDRACLTDSALCGFESFARGGGDQDPGDEPMATTTPRNFIGVSQDQVIYRIYAKERFLNLLNDKNDALINPSKVTAVFRPPL
jgi:hypothetical protein